MATALVDLGLEKGKRVPLRDIFVKLAKTDFWHDFNESLMQELLENASLVSSLSFKQRAENIARIRASFEGGNPTVQQYFMEHLDDILPNNGNKSVSNTTERKLLAEIGVNFDAIESDLKKWNQDHAKDVNYGISNLPEGKEIQPTYSTVKRNYSYNVHPVKAYGQEFFLPEVFEEQTGTQSFVLMIDASHYALSDIAKRIAITVKEIIGESVSYETKYKFYILNSTENDSDPANKISDIEIQTGSNVEIFFLKDDNHTSIYPSTFGISDEQNENLFTAVGIESVRTDPVNNIIGATLSGVVQMKIDDLGEMSKIDKASQKAVDVLIEQNTVSKECLSYFILKRAGDWCQALCLLDKTRKYTVYKRQNVEGEKGRGKSRRKTEVQKLLPLKDEGGAPITVSLQELIDENTDSGGITIALVTLDRILLAFALLLGIDVFFTTKYANLVPDRGGPAGRSIHWSIFFKNMDIGLSETENNKIKENAAAIIKSTEITSLNDRITNIKTLIATIETYLAGFPTTRFKKDIKTYLQSLHFYTYVKTSYIGASEIADIEEQIRSIQEYLRENPAPASDEEILKLRNYVSNYKMIKAKVGTIESTNTKLTTEIASGTNPHPNFAKYESILNEIISIFVIPKNTDLRKSICYNNFLEDIIKSLHSNLDSASSSQLRLSDAEFTVDFFYPGKPEEFTPTRKHDLMIRYLKEGILSGFPQPVRGGGFRIDEEWGKGRSFSDNLVILTDLFFKLRNKQILACNNYKWKQLNNPSSLDASLDDIFIGLKQSYITDINGKYISILDNYIVTDDEAQYFFEVETKAEQTAFKTFIAFLESNSSYKDYLLMTRYIIMRDRLLQCDTMYNEYLTLYQQLNEEIAMLRVDNADAINSELLLTDGQLQFQMISLPLQKKIRDLFDKAIELKENLREEHLFISFNQIGSPSNFYDFLNAILNYLYYIRVNIFSYAKRYYTPSVENDFKAIEVATILKSFKTKSEHGEVTSIISEIKTQEDTLSDRVTAQLTVENKAEKAAAEAKAKEILVNERDKSNEEVLNTLIDFVHEGQKLQTLASISTKILNEEFARKKGGGRKRKTHKKKNQSAKRKTRKH